MSRKGFFFVVTALIILSYILTNLALWSETLELHEKTFSENFKLSNLEFIADQLTQERVRDFALDSADFALYKLNSHTVDNPIKNEKCIEKVMNSLINNGETVKDCFDGKNLVYSPEEIAAHTFKGWFDKIDLMLREAEMKIDHYNFYEFKFSQSDYKNLYLAFRIDFRAEDNDGLVSVERSFSIEESVSILAISDPAITRGFKELSQTNSLVKKPIFFGKYEEPEEPKDLNVGKIANGFGQGWFYGPIHKAGDPAPDDFIYHYILMGTSKDISEDPNKGMYGAYLVLADVNKFEDIKASFPTDKPMAVLGPQYEKDIPDCYDAFTNKPAKCLLFISEYDAEEIDEDNFNKDAKAEFYDIENFRDFTMCSYYVKDENGPSYFQRLMADSFKQKKDKKFGIATVMVWQDIQFVDSDRRSRLDYEFFNSKNGEKIRGMPGCKNGPLCSEDSSPLGQFKLTHDSIEDYLGEQHLSCDNWGATCGD